MRKNWHFFLLALLLTLSSAVYQRLTGPTYPQRLEYNGIHFKLPRSWENDRALQISIPRTIAPTDTPVVIWRHYPTELAWQEVQMTAGAIDRWQAALPSQAAAGKIEYYLRFDDHILPSKQAVVLRFKGPVPNLILIPHVIFMFVAMFFSNLMGLEAIARRNTAWAHARIAFFCLAIGGFILGPLVQLNAFGELWTGIPFGWDLTDNKTLIAGIGFILGMWQYRRSNKHYWLLISALIVLAAYLIPHSVMGSQLDYNSGQVITG
jgi:hypothetical protein